VRRLPTTAILLFLLLSACKVEPTPPEYYEGRYAAGPDLDAAQQEVRAQVDSMAVLLRAGEGTDALNVFMHGPDARIAPSPLEDGERLVLMGRVTVAVSPSANTGWFGASFEGADQPEKEVLVTGVMTRQEGEWTLVQLHASEISPRRPAESDG